MPNEETDDKELATYDQLIDLHKRGGLSEEDYAVQQKVDAALDIAVNENGYEELATWTDMRVATDLIEHSQEFEDFSPARLRRFVKSWQDRHGGNRVEVSWRTGPDSKETWYIPRAALATAETQLIVQLVAYGNRENKRANENALQTMTLGRHLSIALKAMQAMREVADECMRLRRFDGEDDGNPINVAAKGYICMQDGTRLDEAIRRAVKAVEQLEKEYPEAK